MIENIYIYCILNSQISTNFLFRAITVFEKARDVAKALPRSESDHEWTVQKAEIYHNLGTCWERLHEHHAALDNYDKAEKLRRFATTPDVSLRRRAREKKKLKL